MKKWLVYASVGLAVDSTSPARHLPSTFQPAIEARTERPSHSSTLSSESGHVTCQLDNGRLSYVIGAERLSHPLMDLPRELAATSSVLSICGARTSLFLLNSHLVVTLGYEAVRSNLPILGSTGNHFVPTDMFGCGIGPLISEGILSLINDPQYPEQVYAASRQNTLWKIDMSDCSALRIHLEGTIVPGARLRRFEDRIVIAQPAQTCIYSCSIDSNTHRYVITPLTVNDPPRGNIIFDEQGSSLRIGIGSRSFTLSISDPGHDDLEEDLR